MIFHKLIRISLIIIVASLILPQGSVGSTISVDKLPGSTIILSHLKTFSDDIYLPSKIYAPYGIDNNGTHIFVPHYDGNKVTIHDLDGNQVGTLISDAGLEDGQINGPAGVIDNGTHILILDSANLRVQIFDRDMNYLDKFSGPSSITPVDFHHNGTHIFVLDFWGNRLDIFDAAGNWIMVFPEVFGAPSGMLVTEDRIYVSHVGNLRYVSIYDHGGNSIGQFGLYAGDEFDIQGTGGLAIYQDYILHAEGYRLGIYSLEGTPQAAVYTADVGVPFENLQSVTTVNERVYISDADGDAIHVFAINVQDVSASAGSDNVRVSWGSPSARDGANMTHFNVYRGVTSGSYNQIAQVDAENMHFEDNAVKSGETYYYAVTAVNGFGETDYSEEVMVTLDKALTNIIIDPSVLSQIETLTDSNNTDGGSDDGFLSFNIIMLPIASAFLLLLRRRK